MSKKLNLSLLLFCALIFILALLFLLSSLKVERQIKRSVNNQLLNSFEYLNINPADLNPKILIWDSQLQVLHAHVFSNYSASEKNKGRKQISLGILDGLYKRAIDYSPRNVNALIGRVSILIDQGAPMKYLLPKLDFIASLIPKDQDLKADLSMLYFKLLILKTDDKSVKVISDSLNELFKYSMDYRGMLQVIGYAKIFNQNEFLKNIDLNVK